MKKIYNQNKELITKIKHVIYELRRQNHSRGMQLLRFMHVLMTEFLTQVLEHKDYFNEEYVTLDEIYIMELLESITKSQKQNDYHLLADLLELQLLPFLISLQTVIQSKEDVLMLSNHYEQNLLLLEQYDNKLYQLIKDDTSISKRYLPEPTTNGSVTIKVVNEADSFYLTSNNDPQDTARLFADAYYTPRASQYILYGIELLNHANAFIEHKDIFCVEVYESDLDMIKLAVMYGSLHHLSTNRLKIIYDPDLTKLASRTQIPDSDRVLAIHQPSIRTIKKKEIREKFENLFIVDSSIRNQNDWMISNFFSNIKNCNHYVDELFDQFCDKDVYLIAAGPSLDKNIELLRQKPENSIIFAVGTVHKKLENMGVKADYTIITDAKKTLIGQIRGVKKEDFSLILLSTACKELAMVHKGAKYLVCQSGFPEAEKYAKEHNYNLYGTGGSVTTTALDICLRLKAKRVVLLGADMAHTDSQTHATGTLGRRNADMEGLIPIQSVDGGIVYTTRVLNMYKEWIEKRIAKEADAKVIDATEGGAFIKGTRICTLKEIIELSSVKDLN